MTMLVDTLTVPPDERFGLWQDASWKQLSGLRIRRASDEPFSGRMSGYQLGMVQLIRIAGDASTALRTRQAIGVSDPEIIELSVHLRGHCAIAQADRSARTGPGDLVITDTSRPYTYRAVSRFEFILLTYPKMLLGPLADRICALSAVRIKGDDGLASLLGPFAAGLAERLDEGKVVADDPNIGESLLDLLRGLHRERVDPIESEKHRSSTEHLLRAKEFIATHLGDPDLSPEGIARAQFISTRYLHRLFEREGRSVCGWIREQRLERCRRDLADPALQHLTILAVAARWGFRHAAHFSRVFCEAYGCSPRAFRERGGLTADAVSPAGSGSDTAAVRGSG